MGLLNKLKGKDKDNGVISGSVNLPADTPQGNKRIAHEINGPKECKTTLKGLRRNG